MVIKMDAFSFSTPCFCTTDSDACCRETQGKLETCLKETQWIWQTTFQTHLFSNVPLTQKIRIDVLNISTLKWYYALKRGKQLLTKNLLS